MREPVAPETVEPPAASADTSLTWGVGAVAERLGIAASTLRTWERRYGVGPSHRTQGGHRRYTDRDIERVELVHRLVARGVSAQDAARVARGMDRDELLHALKESAPEETTDPVQALVATALTLDAERLDETITRLVGRATFLDTWTRVLSPFVARAATERSMGSLPAEAQDLATQTLLKALRRRAGSEDDTPDVLLATEVEPTDSLPLYALSTALRVAHVSTEVVGPARVRDRVEDALQGEPTPQVLVYWSDRHDGWEPERGNGLTMFRLAPGWPHEARLGTSVSAAMVPTDVAALTEHVLDRIA
ncbi:MAG: MerR family transcriptional regulator [Aeromicrobium erythreum]